WPRVRSRQRATVEVCAISYSLTQGFKPKKGCTKPTALPQKQSSIPSIRSWPRHSNGRFRRSTPSGMTGLLRSRRPRSLFIPAGCWSDHPNADLACRSLRLRVGKTVSKRVRDDSGSVEVGQNVPLTLASCGRYVVTWTAQVHRLGIYAFFSLWRRLASILIGAHPCPSRAPQVPTSGDVPLLVIQTAHAQADHESAGPSDCTGPQPYGHPSGDNALEWDPCRQVPFSKSCYTPIPLAA